MSPIFSVPHIHDTSDGVLDGDELQIVHVTVSVQEFTES